jgi:glycosyltransferase involved in cell wall biosynthesis
MNVRIVAMGCTDGHGGLQTHYKQLVEFLVGEGHEVGVINVGDELSTKATGITFSHTMPQFTPSLTAKLKKLYRFWKARRAAVRFAPDVFLGTASGRGYAKIAEALPRNTFKVHQEVAYEIPESDSLRIYMAQRFDAIGAQSESIKSVYRSRVGASKPVAVLPCFAASLSCDRLPPVPRVEDALRFCFFGRLASNKGIGEFLQAFSEVAEEIDAIFDIYGDGQERRALEDVVQRMNLTERVKLLGRYPDGAEYAKLLTSYHCLILPSRGYEGLPLVLLESMSCGLPYLATNVGAIAEASAGSEDLMLMETNHSGMVDGVRRCAELLRSGTVSGGRLKKFYEMRYAPDVLQGSWRKMLEEPRAYFGITGERGREARDR